MRKLLKLRLALEGKDREQKKEILERLDKRTQKLVLKSWEFQARIKQLPPNEWLYGDKYVWIVLSGRGFGKTRMAVEEISNSCLEERVIWCAVNKSWDDCVGIAIRGDSGFITVLRRRGLRQVETPTKDDEFAIRVSSGSAAVLFGNGSEVRFMSAERPDKIAGYQYHHAWLDEFWLYDKCDMIWAQVQLATRLGKKNRYLITSTPRPRLLLKKMLAGEYPCVLTRGTTYENLSNLSDTYKKVVQSFEGTRAGRQEIAGEALFDNPNAIWQERDILHCDVLPEMRRIVVAIDHAVSAKAESDETGLVVAGLGVDNLYYVIHDASGKYSPDGWAREALKLLEAYKADRIIIERNQGGDLVKQTIHTIDKAAPIREVTATRGKVTRSEPIAAMYEQHKVRHVKGLGKLEDQLLEFDPNRTDNKDDRLDALVWALTDLKTRFEGEIYYI